jgi:hypothetical protein
MYKSDHIKMYKIVDIISVITGGFNMIIDTDTVISDLKIETLTDLKKLSAIEKGLGMKINKSALARKFDVDRRTIQKYIDGYEKPKTRNKSSYLDQFEDTIRKLLNTKEKTFSYKSVLYRYLCDNYNLVCAESSFRRYISNNEEFNNYFKNVRNNHTGGPSISRYETGVGEQAQLDWKESITFQLKDGEVIIINIFVLILSYSRYRLYRLSLTKTQDVLFHFMTEAFELFGGVPKEILTDNMKTVMDCPRTEYRKGKINKRFEQFSTDYGFKVHPCIAGRPQTKAKVESPMKILDELSAYSGDLNYTELCNKLEEINNRENSRFHKEYQGVPLLSLEKEKEFLLPLPQEQIRNSYKIRTSTVKVNKSSMITYRTNQYSVPTKYIGKHLKIQVYDEQLHLYDHNELVAIHTISSSKINYLENHYIEILSKTLPFEADKLEQIAKENLEKIGERFKK